MVAASSPSPTPMPTATARFSRLNAPMSGERTRTSPIGVISSASMPSTV